MRRFKLAALAIAMSAMAASPVLAQEKLRIGYAISKTGPHAAGTGITTLGAYQTWIKDVNEAGGLTVGGKKVPIEVIEYDDRSSQDDMVKAVERLGSEDKVDFILPPWGTAFNLAAGPIFNRLGYPLLTVTPTTNQTPDLVKRWPNTFFLLGMPDESVRNLVGVLSKLRNEKKIGDTIAMVSVDDQLGIEMVKTARESFRKAGFKIVYDETYRVGAQDMQPLIKGAMESQADAFVAFSYPNDTIALTDASRKLRFNPKLFYTAIGTTYPQFKARFDGNADGVMGMGGIDPASPAIRDYMKRHAEANGGREPDRWVSPVTYASLQMLQQAIARVGMDRAKVIGELQTGTFDTIVGKIKLENNLRMDSWQVGQWQNGEYVGIAPAGLEGAKPVQIPKPAWK